MKKPEHVKLPLRVSKNSSCMIIDAGGFFVASVRPGAFGSTKDIEGVVAYILHCVNNYERMRDENERLREAVIASQEALMQANGALRIDAMVDEDGNPYGTTTVALEAIDFAMEKTRDALDKADGGES
jgi:hypothetical protein